MTTGAAAFSASAASPPLSANCSSGDSRYPMPDRFFTPAIRSRSFVISAQMTLTQNTVGGALVLID